MYLLALVLPLSERDGSSQIAFVVATSFKLVEPPHATCRGGVAAVPGAG